MDTKPDLGSTVEYSGETGLVVDYETPTDVLLDLGDGDPESAHISEITEHTEEPTSGARDIEYKLIADVKDEDVVNSEYQVTSITVELNDLSGFTEEQLNLLLQEQMDLTFGYTAGVEGVKNTSASDVSP